MPPRKLRTIVVLDTNVVTGFYLSRSGKGANVAVFKWWFKRHELQLVVSDEVAAEYFEVLERLDIRARRIAILRRRLEERSIVTYVAPGPRPAISRDPDDDVMIAAIAGRAEFLITNDHDLLDIAQEHKRKYRFQIVTPAQFLAQWTP